VVGSGIAPEYFLDSMSADEVSALLEREDMRDRDEWEKIRQVCFYAVLPHTDKVKSPDDLFRFPWEKEKKKPAPASKREIRRRINKITKFVNK
jgi:hypothetical protein